MKAAVAGSAQCSLKLPQASLIQTCAYSLLHWSFYLLHTHTHTHTYELCLLQGLMRQGVRSLMVLCVTQTAQVVYCIQSARLSTTVFMIYKTAVRICFILWSRFVYPCSISPFKWHVQHWIFHATIWFVLLARWIFIAAICYHLKFPPISLCFVISLRLGAFTFRFLNDFHLKVLSHM